MRPTLRGTAACLATALAVFPACGPRTLSFPTSRDYVIGPAHSTFEGAFGVVSAATKEAAEAGAAILARGGNAVDAAVATGFVLAVTEPSMSGLGGRASIIIREPDGTIIGIDGLNQVPSIYRQNSGLPEPYERAAIPGVPAALGHALATHGTLQLAGVLDSAIFLAERGFVLNDGEADRWAAAQKELTAYGAGRGTYLKADGSLWKSGERVTNPLLAATLKTLASEGVESFYRGSLARTIDADMQARGGFIRLDELTNYRALPAIPVRGTYRGHTIASNFRPAAGQAVVQALHTLEGIQVPPPDDRARWASVIAQAMHWALADRATRRGTEEESAAFLTSLEHARDRARRIVMPPAAKIAIDAPPYQAGGLLYPPGTLVTAPTDREATSHFSVADKDGRVVAVTQSLGPAMGTRLVAPGLGFLYATRLGTMPGSRPASTVSPTIVIAPDRGPVYALGGAGDSRIISAVIQVVSRLVDHDMSLREAVAAPRVHPDAERTLRIEDGPVGSWSDTDRALLASWKFQLVPSPSGFFGRVHAVRLNPGNGMTHGVAEPRWTGGASGPK